MADINSERDLVTIQSFRELPEAMLAKGMLNSAGIECFLVDDNTGHMLGFISNVIGGMRMQVNRVDAEAAMALLERPIQEGVDPADEETISHLAAQSVTPQISPSANSTNLCPLAPGSACLFLFTRKYVNANRAVISGMTMTTL